MGTKIRFVNIVGLAAAAMITVSAVLAAFVAGLLALPGAPVCAAEEPRDGRCDVRGVYDLRINGAPHEAREMLAGRLEEDPRDAAAQCEYTRACLHTALCHEEGWSTLKKIRTSSRRIENAWDAANRAAELDPGNAVYQYWKGVAGVYAAVHRAHNPLRWLGMPFQCRHMYDAFETVLALDPDDHVLRARLCGLYARMPGMLGGGMDEAREHLAVLEAAGPVPYALGRAELGYCDLDKAPDGPRMGDQELLALWKNVVAKDPDAPLGHARLAMAYVAAAEGDMETFEENWKRHLHRALKADPGLEYLLLDSAEAWLDAGNAEPARTAVREYEARCTAAPGPMKARALIIRARIEERRGHEARAAALREESRALDPCPQKPGAMPLHLLFVPLDRAR